MDVIRRQLDIQLIVEVDQYDVLPILHVKLTWRDAPSQYLVVYCDRYMKHAVVEAKPYQVSEVIQLFWVLSSELQLSIADIVVDNFECRDLRLIRWQ